MKDAFFHGVWCAFVVLLTHYEVDLAKVSKGYIEGPSTEHTAADARALEPARCWQVNLVMKLPFLP